MVKSLESSKASGVSGRNKNVEKTSSAVLGPRRHGSAAIRPPWHMTGEGSDLTPHHLNLKKHRVQLALKVIQGGRGGKEKDGGQKFAINNDIKRINKNITQNKIKIG